MSERKVLNKYYPPDFDPSKIPRSKEPRNKTFTIRLMAPCNMRCTTCGEYIYKGRKFNSRKEDVDDMNHLGLRIYRFYIKCTACLSEISFRTDPANTDYVLEAGATRNFEALSKAEKQAELEEQAYQEELKTNPMKLLEERTEASKNEMERMEALEELQLLNKRAVKINYDEMLSKYDDIREREAKKQEDEDDAFVKSVFGKTGAGSKVKRILDDGDNDSSDEDRPKAKKISVEKPTDILGKSEPEKSATKNQPWNKSHGILGAGKAGGLLVKPKAKANLLVKPKSTASATSTATTSTASATCTSTEKGSDKAKPSALGLLGQYSDSSGDDSD